MRYVLVIFLLGCTVRTTHRIKLEVGVDTECLQCFPECKAKETPKGLQSQYDCVTIDGEMCSQCAVGCLLGKELTCTDLYNEGWNPRCWNDVPAITGSSRTEVPVICVPEGG